MYTNFEDSTKTTYVPPQTSDGIVMTICVCVECSSFRECSVRERRFRRLLEDRRASSGRVTRDDATALQKHFVRATIVNGLFETNPVRSCAEYTVCASRRAREIVMRSRVPTPTRATATYTRFGVFRGRIVLGTRERLIIGVGFTNKKKILKKMNK